MQLKSFSLFFDRQLGSDGLHREPSHPGGFARANI
jgi:hypothetical protein